MCRAPTRYRSLLARLVVGARNTLGIAAAAVWPRCWWAARRPRRRLFARVAGQPHHARRRHRHELPSLLLALIVLFSLGPSIPNLVLVLAITRVPIYLRTTRAEVLEVRERLFVSAATALGQGTCGCSSSISPHCHADHPHHRRHRFRYGGAGGSSLSFLGLGVQAPAFTWGSMVANGRGYLASAWWVAFWPGLAILLTTLSLNVLSNWWRTYSDPQQRWRLELGKRGRAK